MTHPERIVWREIEGRLRPIDSALVILANGTETEHGPAADGLDLERRVRRDLTDFCTWWLRSHDYTLVPPTP